MPAIVGNRIRSTPPVPAPSRDGRRRPVLLDRVNVVYISGATAGLFLRGSPPAPSWGSPFHSSLSLSSSSLRLSRRLLAPCHLIPCRRSMSSFHIVPILTFPGLTISCSPPTYKQCPLVSRLPLRVPCHLSRRSEPCHLSFLPAELRGTSSDTRPARPAPVVRLRLLPIHPLPCRDRGPTPLLMSLWYILSSSFDVPSFSSPGVPLSPSSHRRGAARPRQRRTTSQHHRTAVQDVAPDPEDLHERQSSSQAGP